ncbi:putative bifunctional diguanylate cyclase/phosphodiesterase [uncultured Enterovirga sp.]|uniref:putative bifunctional diguanylate cyclase/phosphodiesterase n=1 Tax=uncultured Enterovirga sp. TaxID=2026352 RepID=UPI0035CC8DA9
MLNPSSASPGYPVPLNEEERLQELLTYDCPGGTTEASLDQICLLAQSLFKVPVALVTLVGRDEQTFLAKCGVSASGTSREDSFCTYAILDDEVFVVSDATQDLRFVGNPLVTGDMHIRFYAGAPLIVRPGIRVGSLCLIDTEPREFSAIDASRLEMLASMAVNELRRRRATIDLKRQQDLLSQTARMAKVGSWVLDLNTQSLAWSDETYRLFEVEPGVAPTTAMVEGFWGVDGAAKVAAGMEGLVRDGIPFDQDLPIVTARGSARWVHCIAEAELADGFVSRVTGSVQDITEQREHAAKIERLAFRDALTGLPNRALFQKRFATAVAEAELYKTKVGLLMLDLDHFKDVNDTLGHSAGDELLRSVAEQLRSAYSGDGSVARLGGDEFAVILPIVCDVRELTEPTERLLELLRHPREHGGKRLTVSVSVGASLYPDDDEHAEELLKNADIALYRAKSAGRNRLVMFEPSMREEVERRTTLLREIRAGIEADEFVLYYQPLVGVAKPRAVTGFEALMRWHHPVRGVLTPDKFLAGFEDLELSLALGEIALDRAMAQMRGWLDAEVEFGRVAVNLSGGQFRSGDLAQAIMDKLARWRVPAERLTLEVTENVYMGWGSQIVGDTIRALHGAGILIALDDFGTGYASLTNLKQFPIDRLKIDRSFIRDLHDPAIVSAVLSLGASMGMKVVAEGVENIEQLEVLGAMGCDQVQGYFFARPMPAAEVPNFLELFSSDGPLVQAAA